MTTRLQFTEFRHVNPLYTPLNRGSIAVHTCDITFDSSEQNKSHHRGYHSLLHQQNFNSSEPPKKNNHTCRNIHYRWSLTKR